MDTTADIVDVDGTADGGNGVGGGRTRSALPAVSAAFVGGDSRLVDLVITEGKFRQVRRMWEALGNDVLKLARLRFGR
jgi:16S rRNA U516 pseudouridylate synthase RsuA-like enzyme